MCDVLTVYGELQTERDEDNRVSRELIAERGNTAEEFSTGLCEGDLENLIDMASS